MSFGYFLPSREFQRNGADGVTNSGSCCGGVEGTFTIVVGEAIFGEFGKGWWPNSISGDVLVKKLKGLKLFKQEQQGVNFVIREPIPQKRKIIKPKNAIPKRLQILLNQLLSLARKETSGILLEEERTLSKGNGLPRLIEFSSLQPREFERLRLLDSWDVYSVLIFCPLLMEDRLLSYSLEK
jgi:hypothetical protein